MKILVINGPNLNLLGLREPTHYGTENYAQLVEKLHAHCEKKQIEVTCYQSNHEGALVDRIQEAYFEGMDGIVINPGAYTHTSIAILDAVKAVQIPTAEVHISNVDAREAFRHISVIAPACVAQVKGRGFKGYCDAIDILLEGPRERLGEGFEERYPTGEVIAASLK